MTQKEYEQKKRECWEEFKREVQCLPVSRHDVFCAAFDRAYALGKETKTITQEEIEKAAEEYVLTRQQARLNAKREEDATLRDFDKTIKAWDAFDMEQAYEDGANFALGKQEKDVDTVIQGWVCRDANPHRLFIYGCKPTRLSDMWSALDTAFATQLDPNLFPDLTWEDEPQEVEITIKRKKK